MHDFGGRDAPRSDVRKPGTREGGCFRCSRGAGKSISQFGRQEEDGFPLTVFLSPSGLQRVGRGSPHPPPPGRESHVLCAVHRFTRESHPRTVTETPRAVCGPAPGHLVAQPRSQYNHPLQRPWGKCSPRGPAGERRRRARGSSDSATPKHRRRRRESGKPSLSGRSARAQRGGVREAIGLSRLLCCSQRQVRCRSAPE